MKKVIVTLLLCLCCAAMAGAQKLQLSAGYLYQGTQTLGGGSNVGLNGGRAEVAYWVAKDVAMVGEFTGSRSNMGNPMYDLNLVTLSAGPRYEKALNNGKGKSGNMSLFAQFLVGYARGSDGNFPVGGTFIKTANSLDITTGGGMDVKVGKRVSFRPVQVDYMTTQLPNMFGTRQNYFRIGGGMVVRLR